MREFTGFPARMEFTRIPNPFFALLPGIEDIAELKTVLHFFEILYRKKGAPRFVSYGELRDSRSLMSSLSKAGCPPEDALRQALAKATARGVLLHLAVEGNGAAGDVYFLNTASDREAVSRIRDGTISVKGLKPGRQVDIPEETPDIFTLYEQNIGMLTPIIADELQEAEKAYPAEWIRDAIREAVAANKRKWSYVSRILETWTAEGKHDGAHRGHPQETDPDKYVRGKYGNRVQR